MPTGTQVLVEAPLAAAGIPNPRRYREIEQWRTRPLTGTYRYVFLSEITIKRRGNGRENKVSVLIAMGVNKSGFREIVGVGESNASNHDKWLIFLRHLVSRGLNGVQLVVADRYPSLKEAVQEVLPKAKYQRSTVQFYLEILKVTPNDRMKEVVALLNDIFACLTVEEASFRYGHAAERLQAMGLDSAKDLLDFEIADTMHYFSFPQDHWIRIRSDNGMECALIEISQRSGEVGVFPGGQSVLMFVCSVLLEVSSSRWMKKRFIGVHKQTGDQAYMAESDQSEAL